jgi:hypothetical protein
MPSWRARVWGTGAQRKHCNKQSDETCNACVHERIPIPTGIKANEYIAAKLGHANNEMKRLTMCEACPLYPCAVIRRRFPVGANPTRRTLQPEAIGRARERGRWGSSQPNCSSYRQGAAAGEQATSTRNSAAPSHENSALWVFRLFFCAFRWLSYYWERSRTRCLVPWP